MEKRSYGAHAKRGTLALLLVFGAAFGYVEACVVHYLRRLLGFDAGYLSSPDAYRTLWSLGVIRFVRPNAPLLGSGSLTNAEIGREAATLVMLVAVAMLAARGARALFGAFAVAFATWDLTYYGWLRLLEGWPRSLADQDVYFMIPVTWIGPVATPLVASALILVLGAWLMLAARRP